MTSRAPNALNPVYITSVGGYLPHEPVSNDDMERVLGQVGDAPSRLRRIVLKANGITSRHYARRDGVQTHLNEELAARAIEDALERRGLTPNEIGMLAVGTTMPDLLMPGFASMVHGRIGGAPMEVLSTSGVCASGAAAMKAAYTSVLAGQHDRAVAAASELPSTMMKAERFERESELAETRDGAATAYQYFNADFLRWMLSDGAGAVVMENKPNPDALSLRVDWIELTSYAHEYPTCMFLGSSDPRDIAVGKTWLSVDNASAADEAGMMVIRQDTELLAKALLPAGVEEARRLIKTGRIDNELGYDWFLPHISSMYFYPKLVEAMAEAGVDIPQDRWFTNLSTKGNTGSASMFLMLEEALNGGMFEPGDRILAFVPESGRFIFSFMQFTVVEPGGA